jgi:hypothetical protein
MWAALPNAIFVPFTGTPLMAGEEGTQEVFGDYVSICDFQQSVEDGATVPLFYEKGTPELQLVSPGLNGIEQTKRHGLHIVPHRKRMNEPQPLFERKCVALFEHVYESNPGRDLSITKAGNRRLRTELAGR